MQVDRPIRELAREAHVRAVADIQQRFDQHVPERPAVLEERRVVLGDRCADPALMRIVYGFPARVDGPCQAVVCVHPPDDIAHGDGGADHAGRKRARPVAVGPLGREFLGIGPLPEQPHVAVVVVAKIILVVDVPLGHVQRGKHEPHRAVRAPRRPQHHVEFRLGIEAVRRSEHQRHPARIRRIGPVGKRVDHPHRRHDECRADQHDLFGDRRQNPPARGRDAVFPRGPEPDGFPGRPRAIAVRQPFGEPARLRVPCRGSVEPRIAVHGQQKALRVVVRLQEPQRKKEPPVPAARTVQVQFAVGVHGVFVHRPPPGLGGTGDVGEHAFLRPYVRVAENLAGLRHHSSPMAIKLCHSTRLTSGKRM